MQFAVPSRAGRKSKDQLPDVICTQEYAVKIEEEYSINTTVELKGKLAVFCIYVTQCELYSQESSYSQDGHFLRLQLKTDEFHRRNFVRKNAALKCQVETLAKELDEKRRCTGSLQPAGALKT